MVVSICISYYQVIIIMTFECVSVRSLNEDINSRNKYTKIPVGAPLACISHGCMHIRKYKTTHSFNVYESSHDLCRVGAVSASSMSIQACVYASLRTVYHARLHMHSPYICCVYRSDSKAKTALKAQIHLGNTAIVVIPWRKCPWGEKQTFSHDEKSCKKSHCLAKVHLCVFTQPCSALYPVASYHLRESVAVEAIHPCGHTVIRLCELALG